MDVNVMALAWAGALAWPPLALWALWRLAVRRRRDPSRVLSTGMAVGAIASVSLAWFLGVWAFLWEPETLVVRRVEVASSRWIGQPLRIGVISDTHSGAPHMSEARLRAIVARLNAEHPDIIVLLGDYAGGHAPAEARSEAQRAAVLTGVGLLGELKAPLGIVAVLGNHDTRYGPASIETHLVARGIRVLENSGVSIARPGGAFWIAGLAEEESRLAPPSWPDALAGASEGEAVIALTHWPDPFASAPARIALTLAGHTHCGQVNLPIFGRLVSASPAAERWPCGLYNEEGKQLYVTGGVGVSVLPVRFGQPPEIAVVTLRVAG